MSKLKVEIKRIFAVCMAVMLTILSLTGCGRSDGADIPGGGKWVDSDIVDSVKEETQIRLQDDFAAAVNKDFITSTVYDPDKGSMGPLYDVEGFVYKRYRDALADMSITGANVEALRTYEELTLDWDKRNALGVEPLRKYIEDIESISDIDDLTAFQGSTKRNPFSKGMWTRVRFCL